MNRKSDMVFSGKEFADNYRGVSEKWLTNVFDT